MCDTYVIQNKVQGVQIFVYVFKETKHVVISGILTVYSTSAIVRHFGDG